MSRRRMLLAVLLVSSTCGLLRAQSFDLTAQTGPLADLSKAKWRFHTGDDPRWAGPGFDDSQWALLAANQRWDDQGYRQYSGYAWYRIHIKAAPGAALSIAPGHLQDNYEVYADGQNIGHWASMAPDARPMSSHDAWTLLAQIPPHAGEIVLAIRVLHYQRWAGFYGGGFRGGPVMLGDSVAVSDWTTLQKYEAYLRNSQTDLTALLSLLAGDLPLGIALDVEYAATRLHLEPTQSLTLVTDGVVEATAPATRELFGFDRTQAISRQAAQAIAEAARAFGAGAPQADDITVLTVLRAPILEAAPV